MSAHTLHAPVTPFPPSHAERVAWASGPLSTADQFRRFVTLGELDDRRPSFVNCVRFLLFIAVQNEQGKPHHAGLADNDFRRHARRLPLGEQQRLCGLTLAAADVPFTGRVTYWAAVLDGLTGEATR